MLFQDCLTNSRKAFSVWTRQNAPLTKTTLIAESGGQGLIFVVVDFKNFQQARELQDFTRGGTQSEQDKPQIEIAASFEPFDQRGDTGAINVAHFGEIHDHTRSALFTNLAEE